MWDYLVRVLKTEDVSHKSPDVPHSVDQPRPARSSTEADHNDTPFQTSAHAIPETFYCPVCHVRMQHDRWHGAEAYLCPECKGAFLSEAALTELLGAVVELRGDEKDPLIYTPHGLRKGPGESHHSDKA